MEYKILPEQFDSEIFNKCANHPLQSWEWGEVRKKTGLNVIRIGEFEHDILKNVFTMTLHKVPYTFFQIGYIPRSVLPTDTLLLFLNKFGKVQNLLFIKFEPDVILNDSAQSKIKQLTTRCQLQTSPHPLFPTWTQVLDLTPDEDTLLGNMKSKTRYNIRYAMRKGVIVREQSDGHGFEVFANLYFKTTNRQKYRGHNRAYHQTVWHGLKNNYAKILIAYHNEVPLAAYELFIFKDHLYYPYGGSSTTHRDLMGSNLLMWEAIKHGKKWGAKTFDMWGSLPQDYDDRNAKWSGFTRFKEGYGTQFVQLVGSYDLVINPILYPIYNIVYAIRNRLI